MLDYMDQNGRRRQISLGHANNRQAERQRQEKELEAAELVAICRMFDIAAFLPLLFRFSRCLPGERPG
jgi:hypothetical protein